MLKTKIVMNEVVIESDFTPEQLKKISLHRPEELNLYDDDGDIIFKYSVSDCHDGGLSINGITFGVNVNGNGKAVVKIPIGGETEEEKKMYIAENFGTALKRASIIEERLSHTITEIESDITNIMNSIEVVM